MLKAKAILVLFLLILVPSGAWSAEPAQFVNELRSLLQSAKGQAVLFGYSKDFAFAEIKEGAFKVGDMVMIRGEDAITRGEIMAFGEVEEIKDKFVRIYLANVLKPLKIGASVTGLNRIYAKLEIEDKEAYIPLVFLKEPDIVIQDKKDERTNVFIYFKKIGESEYGYRVTTPTGRILLLGTLSIDLKKKAVEAEKGIKIAFDEERGNIWLLRGDELICHTCKDYFTKKISLEGEAKALFVKGGELFIETDREKTYHLKGDDIIIYEGFVVEEGEALYVRKEKKLYDIKRKEVLLDVPYALERLFYWKDGVGIGKDDKDLLLFTKESVKRLDLREIPLVKVRKEGIYCYREVREEVPLAGDFLALYLEVYDIKNLVLKKRLEIRETVVDFDVDEKAGEVIVLKPDRVVKRIKL